MGFCCISSGIPRPPLRATSSRGSRSLPRREGGRKKGRLPGYIRNAFSPQKSIMSHCREDRRECHRFQFTRSFLSMSNAAVIQRFPSHQSSFSHPGLSPGRFFNVLRSLLGSFNNGICLCIERRSERKREPPSSLRQRSSSSAFTASRAPTHLFSPHQASICYAAPCDYSPRAHPPVWLSVKAPS